MKGLLLPLFVIVSVLAAAARAQVPSTALAEGDTLRSRVTRSAVVRAQRWDAGGSAPVQVLEGEELERMGSHSVADALRFFSGVQVKDYGGIGGLKTVNVRGMGSEHVGVVYNGVPVDNAQNGQVDLGRFSLDNMESVALFPGGNDNLLQPACNFASSSSVYLRTREPVFADVCVASGGTSHAKRRNLKAAFRTGSFGLANPSLLWEERWGDGLSSSLSAEYVASSGRYRFRYHTDGGYDTTATRRNGDINALRCEASLFGRLHGGSWRAQAYLYNSRRGLPGAVVRNRFSNAARQWDVNTFLQASARKYYKNYALLLNAKYSYDYLRYLHDPREDDGTMYVDNRYRQQQVFLSCAQRFEPLPRWRLSLSADYRMNALDADLHNFARPVRHAFYGALASEWLGRHITLRANALLTGISNRPREEASGKGTCFTEISPAFFASWNPLAQGSLQLRAFFRKTFRMPTLNDLYYTFLGNSDLRPEYATQYDIGITFERPLHGKVIRAVSLKADVYYNRVADKIVAVPTANLFRWTMMNIGLVRIYGLDVTAQAVAHAGSVELEAKSVYTFQRAEDYTDSSSRYYRGQIPYIPRHSVSAVAAMKWRGWQFNYSFILTGERYDASANIPANHIPAWNTHDASLSWNVQVGKTNLEATMAVNNLLNSHYDVVKCYPMPGRNFNVSLSVRL